MYSCGVAAPGKNREGTRVKKLIELTKKQKGLLPVWRDKWVAYGLSTEAAKWDHAHRWINEAYRAAGLELPKVTIRLDSPMSGAIGCWMLKQMGSSVGDSVWNSVEDSVLDSVGDSVLNSVGDSVLDSVGDSVFDSVRNSVRSSVGDSVCNSVEDSVLDSVGDSVGESVWNSVGDSVLDSVGDSVWDSVGESVWNSVGDSVWNSVRSSVRSSVGESVWDSVGVTVKNSVEDSVRSSVRSSVGESVWDSVWDSVRNACYGQHDAGWLGFYDYFLRVVNLPIERIQGLANAAKFIGWWWPFENALIMTDRPRVLHMNNKELHHDRGPAIKYADGFSVWSLNGVRVPRCLVETKAEELDAKKLMKVKNAEIRREFVRKMGVDLVCQRLNAKRIDKCGNYELLLLDLNDGRQRPYLKMLNPSIGTWHVEGVHPDCNTVEKALNWRNGTGEAPSTLT